MSVVLVESPTLADLLEELGGISPARIRIKPPLGTATEQDVIDIHDRENRLFELVDGVLVEKTMGLFESRVAIVVAFLIESYLSQNDLGFVAGADGMLRLSPGLVRIPDVSFIRWERVQGHRVPRVPIPDLVPNLAVEVLSPSNTAAEMDRKLRDYFNGGAERVWYIDPQTRTAQVWTSPGESVEVDENGMLDGGTLLPGFRLAMRDQFARAEGGSQS
jgi:Uma2 family endonuclease